MEIRSLISADREPLATMLKSVDEFCGEEINCALELAYLSLDDPEGSGYQSLVAEHDGKIAGYLCYGPTPLTKGTYDLYWVVTAKEFRKQHAASALVNEMESRLRAHNARLVRVETSSLNEYGPARAFYVRLAYEPIVIIKNFYHPGDDLVVLTKNLTT